MKHIICTSIIAKSGNLKMFTKKYMLLFGVVSLYREEDICVELVKLIINFRQEESWTYFTTLNQVLYFLIVNY